MKRILSLLVAMIMALGTMSFSVFAEEVSGISDGDYIYFGNDENNRWLVLDADQNSMGGDGMFLVLANPTEKISFNSEKNNSWEGSNAKSWCNSYFENNFSEFEKSAIATTTKTEGQVIWWKNGETTSPWVYGKHTITDARLFFLSLQEAAKYGLVNSAGSILDWGESFWLRSPQIQEIVNPGTANETIVDTNPNVATVSFLGAAQYGSYDPTSNFYARPAFNLDTSKVQSATKGNDGVWTLTMVGEETETNADVIVEDVEVEIAPVDGVSNSYEITLAEGETLPDGGVTMAFPAVEGASDGDYAYVVHEHEGSNYIYVGKVEDGKVTIKNTVGFSTFTVYEGGLQEAIKAAAPDGTVEILTDVTVDKWIMFAQNLSIGNGNLITLNMDGLTINGNGYTLTVNSIESAGNGNRLFSDAKNLNINDLTIKYADGLTGGISLQSGTISNVTFDGGTYGVLPGNGHIMIEDCTFKTNSQSIYFEGDRDNLVVTGNTFDTADDQYAILLRGDVEFTNNTITTGKVNVVNGSPVVTGNDFGDERFKVYNGATATITGNTINNLVFNDATATKSTFSNNTMSTDAQDALEAVTPAPVEVATYEELVAALEKDNANIIMTADITGTATSGGYNMAGIVLNAGDVLDGNGYKLTINGANDTWDCAIAMKGGTVKNLTIAGAMRGVFMPGANGDVVIDNCVFKNVIYTFNSDAGNKNYSVTIKNTTLNGWTSFSNVHKSVTFEGCEFGEGRGYAYCRPYNDTTFTGCEFNEGFVFDAKQTTTPLKFNDCTYASADLTAENGNVLFPDGGTVVIDNGTVVFEKYVSPVAQIGETKYATLAEAIENANGATVTLIADTTENITITDDATVVINLGGKTLNGYIAPCKPASLTVKNGSIKNADSSKSAIEVNAGKLDLETVNIDSARHAVRIDGAVTATINGGTYKLIPTSKATQHAVNVSGAATVTIVDGTFVGPQGTIADSGCAVFTRNPATVIIEGGSFSGGKNATLGNKADDPGTLTVKGGTYDQNPAAYVAEGYAALLNLDNQYVVGEKPTATVTNMGALTVEGGEYTALSGENSTDMPLSFVMQFLADQDAEDMETSPFADWYGDFVLTFTGIENGSFTADDCYLAGYYGDFGWVKVPVDGMTIEDGVRYPVMLGVGMGQKYDYICESVKDFRCALYLTPEILAANPDIQVSLELSVVDNSKGEDKAKEALADATLKYVNVVGETEYVANDFVAKTYVAQIGNTYYESLAEAIEKATAGDTIELIADVTEDVTVNKSITIDGKKSDTENFSYTGNISVEGSSTSVTVKNVNFVNGTGYAITTNRIKSITVEDCTVNNYGYGFLYANKSTPTVKVKNVTVSGGNYGFHWVYGTSATLENVTMTNVTNGLYIQNYAGKTITLTNCNISSISIWERASQSGVQTFKFEGNNTVSTLSASQYAKYVLAAADATLTAPESSAVESTVDGYKVAYAKGKYSLKEIEEVEKFKLHSMNIDLEGALVANFYVDPKNLSGEGYYAKIVHSSQTGDNVEIIDFAQWTDNNGFKCFSYSGLAAKNMADKITATIFDKNGVAVSEPAETSLSNYALYYIGANVSDNMSEYQSAWVKAFVDMLNYGAEAQKYFDYNESNLANEGAQDYQDYATKEDIVLVSDAVPTGAVHSSNLDLVDRIVYNAYFKDVTEDMHAEVSFINHVGEEITETIPNSDIVLNNGLYQVSVKSLVVADAGQPITIVIKDDDGNVHASLTESVNGYLARIIPYDSEFAPLGKAMAKFTTSVREALHTMK